MGGIEERAGGEHCAVRSVIPMGARLWAPTTMCVCRTMEETDDATAASAPVSPSCGIMVALEEDVLPMLPHSSLFQMLQMLRMLSCLFSYCCRRQGSCIVIARALTDAFATAAELQGAAAERFCAHGGHKWNQRCVGDIPHESRAAAASVRYACVATVYLVRAKRLQSGRKRREKDV